MMVRAQTTSIRVLVGDKVIRCPSKREAKELVEFYQSHGFAARVVRKDPK